MLQPPGGFHAPGPASRIAFSPLLRWTRNHLGFRRLTPTPMPELESRSLSRVHNPAMRYDNQHILRDVRLVLFARLCSSRLRWQQHKAPGISHADPSITCLDFSSGFSLYHVDD